MKNKSITKTAMAALWLMATLSSCSDILDDGDEIKDNGVELKFIARTDASANGQQSQTRVTTEEKYDDRWGWFSNEDFWEMGDLIGINASGYSFNYYNEPFRTYDYSSGYVEFLPEGQGITVPSGEQDNVTFSAYYPYLDSYLQFNLEECQSDPILEQLRVADNCKIGYNNTVELDFHHLFSKLILRTYSDPFTDFEGNKTETTPLEISASVTRQKSEASFYPGSTYLYYDYEQQLKTIPFTAKSSFRDSLNTYEAFVLPQFYGREVDKDSMPEIRYTIYGMMNCKTRMRKDEFGNQLNIWSGNAYEMRIPVTSGSAQCATLRIQNS